MRNFFVEPRGTECRFAQQAAFAAALKGLWRDKQWFAVPALRDRKSCFAHVASGNPRRTLLGGKKTIYGWTLIKTDRKAKGLPDSRYFPGASKFYNKICLGCGSPVEKMHAQLRSLLIKYNANNIPVLGKFIIK
jgi:hypothetical protein